MQVARVIDAGQGLLVVEGNDNGLTFVAVVPVASEVLTHYPADQRDTNGELLPDAQPRRMTEPELVGYAEQLLAAVGSNPGSDPHILYSI